MGALLSAERALAEKLPDPERFRHSGLEAARPRAQSDRSQLTGVWRRQAWGVDYVLSVAALVVAYYAAAHVGYAFGFSGPVAAIVWLPVGVGIAFLYLCGTRFWPGLVLGDLLVNNYSALPLGSALGQSVGNLLEVLVATLLLRRLCNRRGPLVNLRGVAGLIVAIAAGTFLSATIGSFSSWLGGAVTTRSLPYVWRTWWLGDFSGALIVVPLAISWSRLPPRPWRPARVFEAGLTALAVVGLSAISLTSKYPVRSLAFPALIWAALRFGSCGATAAITVMSAAAIWASTHFIGPFAIGSIGSRLLETQLFIAAVSVSALLIVALVSEREQLAERLRASRRRLVAASDEGRRRLERDLHDGAQQRLVALAARLSQAAEEAREAGEQAADSLRTAESELLMAIDELRQFARGVHPSVLRQFGLATAVAAIAARSSIPIELIELPRVRLDDASEATAYYVVLEALTNAQKYARASVVTVRAQLGDDVLVLEVTDDGIGGAVERAGSGLQGLRDRVEAIGGTFRVESEPGRATRIAAKIPAAGTTIERPTPDPADHSPSLATGAPVGNPPLPLRAPK